MSEKIDTVSYLDAAQRLMEFARVGDADGVERIIDELTHIRETALFKELGALTRELHESLKSFKLDTRIAEITENEIPDARERLNYVITMTEQAANRTLTAIEESMPAMDALTGAAAEIASDWQRFRGRQMSVDEFRGLSKRIEAFLVEVGERGSEVQTNLTDALMAQDFQDLTGQIIRRVISLVQEVEENLVSLVRISGGRIASDDKSKPAENGKTDASRGEGPRIPGQQDDDFVQDQDDVDDLLSSLGF